MLMKQSLRVLFCGSLLALAAATLMAQPAANYDESKVPRYTLPDPLVAQDGTKIDTPALWTEKRRPEILALFEQHVYGKAPGRPAQTAYSTETAPDALDGRAVRKQIAVTLTNNGRSLTFDLLVYLPADAPRPVPVFLGLNFQGNHSIHTDPQIRLSQSWIRPSGRGVTDNRATEESRGAAASRWPVEMILARGYGLATIYYGDIDPDFDDGFQNGVHPLFYRDNQTRPAPDEWASIAAWAWGLSRAMDYFETDPDIDHARVAVMGHSRLGKTSLWAGATDLRFAMVISNNSGCGGAALSRRAFGETVRRINTSFPHWFCTNYRKYNDNEDACPVDQHQLIALIAPRPVYVASAEKDLWADPKGEFLAAKHAEPVYRLLGAGLFDAEEMPPLDRPVQGAISYHIRTGGHDVLDYDWLQYMNVADRFLGPATAPASADWPQWRGPARDGVWTAAGLVERFDAPQIPLKWQVPIGPGYSGPTVANGRVYVMDRITKPAQQERVLCFDAETGAPLWSFVYDCRYQGVRYEAGPRCSVTVHDGKAYAFGTMGHLHCLDAATGKLIWSRDCREEYRARIPIWGIAGSPLIEGPLVIVPVGGRDGACIVAFDRLTGQEKWRSLEDGIGYSSPVAIDQAGRRIVVCWTADRIVGLDAATGDLQWHHATPWERWALAIPTPVVHEDLLLLSDGHIGSLLFRLAKDKPAIELLWHHRREEVPNEAALHCLISTPFIDGSHIYGADENGILRCLRTDTGEQLWEDRSGVPHNKWATIHLVRNGETTWMFNERGELIISRLTPEGFNEISRAKLIDPTTAQLNQRGGVCWSHPAFAGQSIYARNDNQLVRADLAK